MTLNEGIKYAEKKAEELRNKAEYYKKAGVRIYGLKECAKEYDQIEEWLKELKNLREQTRWIPVSERLPESGKKVIVKAEDLYYNNGEGSTGIVIGFRHADIWQTYTASGVERVRYPAAWMPLPKYEPQESEGV